MEHDFLSKIDELYNEEKHEEIIKLIEALPEDEKEYNILIMLAKAYYDIMDDDDTAHFEKTLSILKSISDDGESDLVWMYLIAKTYFNLNQEEIALEYFERIYNIINKDSDDIPVDVAVGLFIDSCRECIHTRAVNTFQSVLQYFLRDQNCNCEKIEDNDDCSCFVINKLKTTIYIDFECLQKNICTIKVKTIIDNRTIDWETFECYCKTLENAVVSATAEYLKKLQTYFI